MPDRRQEGAQGEDKAVEVLRKEGYKVITRNYRSPFGEVDIIARDGGYLVFVEVKTRTSRIFGDPMDAITADKKRHIIRSALFYMKQNRVQDKKIRFDVLGIVGEEVKLVKNAFLVE